MSTSTRPRKRRRREERSSSDRATPGLSIPSDPPAAPRRSPSPVSVIHIKSDSPEPGSTHRPTKPEAADADDIVAAVAAIARAEAARTRLVNRLESFAAAQVKIADQSAKVADQLREMPIAEVLSQFAPASQPTILARLAHAPSEPTEPEFSRIFHDHIRALQPLQSSLEPWQPTSISLILSIPDDDDDEEPEYQSVDALPAEVRDAVLSKFASDYSTADLPYLLKADQKRHKAYLAFIRPSMRPKMERARNCVNAYLYHSGRMDRIDSNVCCRKCFNANRICARMALHQDTYKLCLFPYAEPGQQPTGDWKTAKYWVGL